MGCYPSLPAYVHPAPPGRIDLAETMMLMSFGPLACPCHSFRAPPGPSHSSQATHRISACLQGVGILNLSWHPGLQVCYPCTPTYIRFPSFPSAHALHRLVDHPLIAAAPWADVGHGCQPRDSRKAVQTPYRMYCLVCQLSEPDCSCPCRGRSKATHCLGAVYFPFGATDALN